MIPADDEFKQIEKLFSDMFDHGVNADDLETFEMMYDTIVDRQITLMTGSRFLSNVKKEMEPLVLQAAKESGFNIYIEQVAYHPDDWFPILNMVGIYSWDIKKNHVKFWDKLDQLKLLL